MREGRGLGGHGGGRLGLRPLLKRQEEWAIFLPSVEGIPQDCEREGGAKKERLLHNLYLKEGATFSMDLPILGLGQSPKATNESKLGHACAAPPSLPRSQSCGQKWNQSEEPWKRRLCCCLCSWEAILGGAEPSPSLSFVCRANLPSGEPFVSLYSTTQS